MRRLRQGNEKTGGQSVQRQRNRGARNQESKSDFLTSRLSYFHVSLYVPLCLCFIAYLGCSQESGKQVPASWNVNFFPLGAKIHFASNLRAQVQQIRAFDSADGLVAQLNFQGHPRRMESLYFRWKKGTVYRFEVKHGNSELTTKVISAPQIDPRGTIEIAIPYGTVDMDSPSHPLQVSAKAAQSRSKSLVLSGSQVNATVLVRNGLEAPITFDVMLQIPSSIQVLQAPSVWDSKGERDGILHYSASGKFTVESEVWYSQWALKLPDERLSTTARISGTVFLENASGEQWKRTVTVPLRSATLDEIAGQLSIEKVVMPTDARGNSDSRQRPDAISHLRPLLGGLGRWFGARERYVNEFEPVAYQTVHIHNHSHDTIHVIVASINRDLKRGDTVPFLAPPDAINAGTNRSLAFVSLTGESTTTVPLPIYFNPASTHADGADFIGAGRYERAIEAKIWGSNTTVLHTTRPLLIVTPNLHALFVTCVVIVATSLGSGLLLRFHQRLFSLFSTKQLILISLFGTTIFIAVSVPSTLLANLVPALLGPIAFLITGSINEMLYYTLLTSLLMLIPKAGVITLVSAVRLLLGSVMLGLFTPASLLYTGSTILLLEAGFQFARKGANILALALVFGICDAISVYVDFQLSITLYRLFYADWYILARIFIDGFVYTFAGVLLGRQLGRGLWRIAD